MTTGKAILIIGGVGVAAFVVLQFMKRTPSPAAPPNKAQGNADYAWVTGLANLGINYATDYYNNSRQPDPAAYRPLEAGYEGPVLTS